MRRRRETENTRRRPVTRKTWMFRKNIWPMSTPPRSYNQLYSLFNSTTPPLSNYFFCNLIPLRFLLFALREQKFGQHGSGNKWQWWKHREWKWAGEGGSIRVLLIGNTTFPPKIVLRVYYVIRLRHRKQFPSSVHIHSYQSCCIPRITNDGLPIFGAPRKRVPVPTGPPGAPFDRYFASKSNYST